jgi:hypothetical protein
MSAINAGREPTMACRSMLCREPFAKRHVKCPKCGCIGVDMVFKHRRINDRFWSVLEAGKLWCPSAHSLNDPFEFEFRLLTSQIEGHPIIQGELEEARAAMKNYGVLSFVEVCDSIRMWAYYSDSHQGVCLGFERNESNDLGKWEHCIPVRYHDDNELPAVMPLALTQPETVTTILTTKSSEWSFEHEWRMLTYESNVAIPYPGRLARIVFGVRTKAQDRARIRAILGDSVDYFQASKSHRFFVLSIDPAPAA